MECNSNEILLSFRAEFSLSLRNRSLLVPVFWYIL